MGLKTERLVICWSGEKVCMLSCAFILKSILKALSNVPALLSNLLHPDSTPPSPWQKSGGLFPKKGKAEGVWTAEGEAAQVKVVCLHTHLSS